MFYLLKKRKDILAIVVTTADAIRALRAYKSIKDSKKTVSMDIEIIVNSMNKNYINEIKEVFKGIKVIITETKSNGFPGFGKNTAFEHFRNHKNNYDFLFYIDGDDFIYPCAFEQFEKLLQYNADILGLQSTDFFLSEKDYRVSDFINKTKEKNDFLHPVIDSFYLHSWNDLEINLSKRFVKDIFAPIQNQYPPDRVLFFSKDFLTKEKDIGFPNDMNVYDDYVFSFQLFERALNKDYSYAQFSSSYCYVYDRINDAAETKKHEDNGVGREWIDKKAKEYLIPLSQNCEIFDFSIVPHLKIGTPDNFKLEDKILFLKNHLIF